MKKLDQKKMHQITGGEYSNKQCAILGAGTFVALVTGLWGAALSMTTLATSQGCFEKL